MLTQLDVKFQEFFFWLGVAIHVFKILIKNFKDDVGTNTGNDTDVTDRYKSSLGLVKTKYRKVRRYSPKRVRGRLRRDLSLMSIYAFDIYSRLAASSNRRTCASAVTRSGST